MKKPGFSIDFCDDFIPQTFVDSKMCMIKKALYVNLTLTICTIVKCVNVN